MTDYLLLPLEIPTRAEEDAEIEHWLKCQSFVVRRYVDLHGGVADPQMRAMILYYCWQDAIAVYLRDHPDLVEPATN
jgi:hypothetical protein